MYSVALRNLTAITRAFSEKFPTKGAFYAFTPRRATATIDLWRRQLGPVTPFYAVKCNPSPIFLNHLFDAKLNFDCASEREIMAVQALARNTLPERVVYANPCKSERDLMAAKQVGSPMTVVDSVEEVEKLAATGYEGGALIRLAVDDSAAAMPFSSKFGATGGLVEPILKAAVGLNFPIHGFSFHVGSGSASHTAFADAMRDSLRKFPLLRSHFPEAKILDIGGGFLPNEEDFRKKAIHIRGVLEDTRQQGIRVIAEPGRFFAANAFDFFVKVIGKKPAINTYGKQYGWKYTVDDSVYGQFTNILFDQAKPMWLRVPKDAADERLRDQVTGTLFGRTCDSLDTIATATHMEKLEVGDWLWFPQMGAYTHATASEFNGFPMPETVVLQPHEILPESIGAPEFVWRSPKGVRYSGGVQGLAERGLLPRGAHAEKIEPAEP